MCLRVFTSHNHSANSVAFTAWGFSFMPRCPSWQPGGDRVRGGLLGHAVVADNCVESAPRVGILGGVIGLKRGWDTSLVLWRSKKRSEVNVLVISLLNMLLVGFNVDFSTVRELFNSLSELSPAHRTGLVLPVLYCCRSIPFTSQFYHSRCSCDLFNLLTVAQPCRLHWRGAATQRTSVLNTSADWFA